MPAAQRRKLRPAPSRTWLLRAQAPWRTPPGSKWEPPRSPWRRAWSLPSPRRPPCDPTAGLGSIHVRGEPASLGGVRAALLIRRDCVGRARGRMAANVSGIRGSRPVRRHKSGEWIDSVDCKKKDLEREQPSSPPWDRRAMAFASAARPERRVQCVQLHPPGEAISRSAALTQKRKCPSSGSPPGLSTRVTGCTTASSPLAPHGARASDTAPSGHGSRPPSHRLPIGNHARPRARSCRI